MRRCTRSTWSDRQTRRRSHTILVALVGVALAAGGCRTTVAPVATGSPRPPSPESLFEERLTATMAGLVYRDDHVLVDPSWSPLGLGEDAALALADEGATATREGRRFAALRAFTDAVVAAPWLPAPYTGLGKALIAVDRRREAVAAYLTALELDPSSLATRHAAAATLQSVGRLDDAILEWRRVVDAEPDDVRANARLGAAYFLRGEAGMARRYLQQASSLGARLPGVLASYLARDAVPTAEVRQGEPGRDAPSIEPPVRVDVGGGTANANETTIAAADPASLEVVAAWNDLRDSGQYRVGTAVSLDGGQTWSDSLLRPPPAYQCDLEGDPMTASDHRTGELWAGGVAYTADPGGIWVAHKQPGSASFEPAVMVYPTSEFVDKPWLGTGRRPDAPDSTRLYVAYHPFLQYSDDLGATWSSPTQLDFGYGHLPRVGPEGELVIGYWDTEYGINIQRSFDGGATVSAPIQIATRVDIDVEGGSYPGAFRVWPFTHVAVDRTTGTVYAVWQDVTSSSLGNSNVDLLFSRSTDHGTTWTTPTVINGDSDPPGDQFFPWLEVDRRGRLHMVFLDTRNVAQSDTSPTAWLDAYYSTSDDGGDSWTEYRLTPTSYQCSSWFIGDYSGLTVAGERVYAVYVSSASGDTDIYVSAISYPTANLFEDGFESGDTSAWSATMP